MANLAKDFEEMAKGEAILSAVIGEDDRAPWGERDKFAEHGKVLTWEEARPILDYEYNSGYGGEDCHAAYIWTATRVLFVHEYDGATGVQCIPRNPVACAPQFGGSYE